MIRRALIAATAVLLPTACASSHAVVGPVGVRVTVTEADAGHTVRVVSGDTVVLLLHSTAWQPSSAPTSVLRREGAPTVAPTGGPTCRPGAGCGTVTADFTAHRPGTAQLTAARTSCGEARRCPPGQARFSVTVVVTGRGS